MKLLSPERAIERPVPSTVQRRWRWAALAGLIVFLALAAYAVAVVGAGKASTTQPVSVLVAASNIRAGDTLSAGALRATGISPQDPGLLLTLVQAQDRSRLIGQVASISVPAGQLIPANIVGAPGSNTLWTADVPIKRMPARLAAGDHVALLTEALNTAGQPVDFVFMQDVEVVHVGKELETRRSLTCDDARIVVGMHDREAFLRRDRLRTLRGIREHVPRQHDARAEPLGSADFRKRRTFRHHDRRRDAQPLGLIRDGLGMVSGRHRDDAARSFVRPELEEPIRRAAVFERPGSLPRLELEEEFRAYTFADRRG